MKRPSSMPTRRFAYHSSESHNCPDPRLDSWIAVQADPTEPRQHAIGFTQAGLILLGLLLAILFFGCANALTGEAQETQAGHSSSWQGPRMVARVQWGAQ